MISELDKQTIVKISKKYKATRVLLFGSSLRKDEAAKDIDLGVEGVPDSSYFSFYGELMCSLSKPVDVVDLGPKTKFTAIVKEEGLPIYG
ncbi:MAG: hypothetical protein PF904_16775 [Kiritimatiellae bacterium]|jgi:predicted nucleotidyltransferase|nr:hypothetical protein [Kiritimatiellia bacterium]